MIDLGVNAAVVLSLATALVLIDRRTAPADDDRVLPAQGARDGGISA